MVIPKDIRMYASEDLTAALNEASETVDISSHTMTITRLDSDDESYEVHVTIDSGKKSADITWTYVVDADSDAVYASDSVKDIVDSIVKRFGGSDIKASKSGKRQPIMAAEDDAFSDFDEFADDEPAVSEPVGDADSTLEGIADDIEDMQDTLDDIQEDDVDIEVDNNIAEHFIAECEACHGVFISAVVMSDQVLESIHGTCPLCEKESDQYLKWVIKDVNDIEDSDESTM